MARFEASQWLPQARVVGWVAYELITGAYTVKDSPANTARLSPRQIEKLLEK